MQSGTDFDDKKVWVFTAEEVGMALAEIFPNDASPELEVAPSAPRPSTPVISVGISDLTDKEKIDEDSRYYLYKKRKKPKRKIL